MSRSKIFFKCLILCVLAITSLELSRRGMPELCHYLTVNNTKPCSSEDLSTKPCFSEDLSTKPSFSKDLSTKPCFSEDKKEISRRLIEAHLALKSSLAHKLPPSPGVLLDLEGIIEQLDPAYALSNTREKTVENVNTSVVVDVCPEKYLDKGEYDGWPFYKIGWVTTNCTNARPLPKLVTILLNTIDYSEKDEKQVGKVLEGINNTYPGVRTFLAPKNDHIRKLASKYQNVTVISTLRGPRSLAYFWNRLVDMVTTPYALVARDVVHFDFNARLGRQIRMISETDYVGVVGGAFRNLTGHWKVGCRQTKMMNYVLRFQEGYHYSRKSCMFCDDLEGPFISKTELLKSTKFKDTFSKEIIFEDFFIRVIRSGHLVMNCPDVMYYTTDKYSEAKITSKQAWQVFAREWVLVRILLSGARHSFSCKEIAYKCNARSITKYAALPMCCMEQYGIAMQFFQDFCVKNNIIFELDSGSALGGVKFSNFNPFDIDGDMRMPNMNVSLFKNYTSYFAKNGYPIGQFIDAKFDRKGKVTDDGFFRYCSPDIDTEVFGREGWSAQEHLPPELRDIKFFTKVPMDGHYINTMFNPGLYSRNRYGLDVLKHSQSWRHRGGEHSRSRYKPGTFVKCDRHKFHSCLDKFPTDGNIAFKVEDCP